MPAENLIGEEHLGWGMAKTTLANERVSLSTGGGLQWGYGPSARDLVQLMRDQGGLADEVMRQRVIEAYIEGEILRYHRMRMISAAVNKRPGPDASLRKALADPHGKKVFTLGRDLMGAEGMLAGTDVTDAGNRGCAASCSAPRSPSAAARARCCATSSPNASSACPTTTTSSKA